MLPSVIGGATEPDAPSLLTQQEAGASKPGFWDDLCRMLGYAVPEPGSRSPRPWAHITCDGTVANIEAIWSARNARFYALAVRAALSTTTRRP
jgi:hypothetical protein